MKLSPDDAATMVSFMVGEPDPAKLAEHIARIEARRRRPTYRLFASRYTRETDRLLIAKLRIKMEDAQRCQT